MKYFIQFAVFIKRIVIFFGSILLILWVYQFIIPDVYQRENILVALMVFWLFTAYIVLPRIHRFLSRIYIPDQFIGRTRTGDGLLSDPVNLALNGTQKEFLRAMEKAGWELAEPISVKTAWRMVKSVVLKKSYPTAPVSDAFLFGERHKFAFQKEVAGNPHARHHVRFWKTPRGWYLPGGYKVDWLGAATYDEAVGISFFTWQFTHRICPDVDKERNFLIATLQEAGAIKKSQHIEHFFPGYRSRNGFGNHFITDGSMVIADLMSHKRK